MKNLILAAAFAVGLPAVAHAQAAPAPTPEKECCCKKMADKDCCPKKADGTTAADPHAGHDMSKM